jgi:hypothetical protein
MKIILGDNIIWKYFCFKKTNFPFYKRQRNDCCTKNQQIFPFTKGNETTVILKTNFRLFIGEGDFDGLLRWFATIRMRWDKILITFNLITHIMIWNIVLFTISYKHKVGVRIKCYEKRQINEAISATMDGMAQWLRTGLPKKWSGFDSRDRQFLAIISHW